MNTTNPLTQTKEWRALEKHYEFMRKIHMKELFKDEERFKIFSIEEKSLSMLLDYSKNIITEETIKLLIDLARASSVKKYAMHMYEGEKINWTENRAVLHIALRNISNTKIIVNGKNVMTKINTVLEKMNKFSDDIRTGNWRGATDKKIENVLNIGIGGSDLGPRMVCEALKYYADGPLVQFISNVDQLAAIL